MPSPNNTPFSFRDFSKGIFRKASVSEALIPDNSVSHSINVNYDTIIGKAVVRKGTTVLGTTGSERKTPLGLTEFVPSGSTSGFLIAAFQTTNGALYFYNSSSWSAASSSVSLSSSAYNRFANLGNRVFRVNGSEAMTSSADGSTWDTTNCITTDSIIPSVILQTKQRLLAAGDITAGTGHSRSRVFFSSVININASPTLTWNTNLSTGDWIDINPDDGDWITGFGQTSGLILIFKNHSMYRLNVVTKTVDTDNIFNIGAPSQEAITNCQGVTYFFSGQDIRYTNGDLPVQISRLGVQDWIDAIPQANWSSVVAGTDGTNVYFSIGNVTLFTNQNEQQTFNNVILKFSTRDQSWSVHSYGSQYKFFSQYTTSANGRTFVGSDDKGNVQTLNLGTNDGNTTIGFLLETQELELGLRSHIKQLGDTIIMYMKNGMDSQVFIKPGDGDFIPIRADLSRRVSDVSDVNIPPANYFTLKWAGSSSTSGALFEGFEIPTVTDNGIGSSPI